MCITMNGRCSWFFGVLLLIHSRFVLGGVISSTPGVQRCNLGFELSDRDPWMTGRCRLTWTLTDTSVSYVVYNQTTGINTALDSRGRYEMDKTKRTITLILLGVRLWDAGNYSLSINGGAESDSNAVLFVYGYVEANLTLTSERHPPIEGDTVDLTCFAQSSSLPSEYRPSLSIKWRLHGYSACRVMSNGTAVLPTGAVLSRYMIRNDSRILTIASVRQEDMQSIMCVAQEDGALYPSYQRVIDLFIQHRPVVWNTNPPSKKFNAAVGDSVLLSVSYNAYPVVYCNWTFTSTQGQAMSLPDNYTIDYHLLSFTLISTNYYGNYTCTVTNAIGTASVTIQVLPPGPPDVPALALDFASHNSVSVVYTCMWANCHSRMQTLYIVMRNLSGDIKGTCTVNWFDCYRSSGFCRFWNNLLPDTNYVITSNATNELGSSAVSTLLVKTAKVLRFVVSPDSIQIDYPRAVINFRIEGGNVSYFDVVCHVEPTPFGAHAQFNVNSTANQVTMNIGKLPNHTEYVFDFTMYIGKKYVSYANIGSVKGIIVYTTQGPYSINTTTARDSKKIIPLTGTIDGSLIAEVTLLAIGIVIVVCIVGLVGITFRRCRQERSSKILRNQEIFFRDKNRENPYRPKIMGAVNNKSTTYGSLVVVK